MRRCPVKRHREARGALAISLIFGILVSTLLTLVVIPLLYYTLLSRRS
ncbi:hypothetical protein [Aeromonas rivipollensis]|nr:hypothetical protein [uncultured Aeromonas sp.]MDU1142348.1 hypothetical protein [Aeromonas hydrophila]